MPNVHELLRGVLDRWEGPPLAWAAAVESNVLWRTGLRGVTVAFTAGCVAIALPPVVSEIGATVPRTGGDASSVGHFAIGMHSASAALDPSIPVDVGLGYVIEGWGLRGDEKLAKGLYADMSLLHRRGPRSRAVFGVRGQWLFDGRGMGHGIVARVGQEWFQPVIGTRRDRCGADGFFAGASRGTVGGGFFAQAGFQALEGREPAFEATAGITLRSPPLAAVLAAAEAVLGTALHSLP